MSLPDSYASFIRLRSDGYPPVERHLHECQAELQEDWVGEREATELELLVLPICDACKRAMKVRLTPAEQEKLDRAREAHRVAIEAAGWSKPPPVDERKLRYGNAIEVQGGLPSLGKGQ